MKQIIIIILLVTIYMLIKKNSINEYFDNDHNTKTDYRKFKKTLNKYKGKKKYILVFSAGPTLKNFKKTDIPNYVWDDCYVIAVKNCINFLIIFVIFIRFFRFSFISTHPFYLIFNVSFNVSYWIYNRSSGWSKTW